MAEQKTLPTSKKVDDFLNEITDQKRKEDCFAISRLMSEVVHAEPTMWGPSIVGFGSYHYKYESGREGDAPLVGFSPRKQNLTLYLMSISDQKDHVIQKLGKFKMSKGCLYINKLEDVNVELLKELIKKSVDYVSNKYKK